MSFGVGLRLYDRPTLWPRPVLAERDRCADRAGGNSESIEILTQLSHFTPYFAIIELKMPNVFTTVGQGVDLADGSCAA